ncbi:11704_t:CDS:2 [Dentiscutata erythropus]|uniref:11704_t:CDS:1 n=1 Tax=Dentiscutata erythropus TaxID=1348616 RepID=A0A9N8W0C6_9GLOM|nr:11704_t:CDS:2 [Dentiscutata erythropus]
MPNRFLKISDKSFSEHAKSTKSKEILTAIERAKLRYSVSGLINILANI